jgi:dihydrofolate reductase
MSLIALVVAMSDGGVIGDKGGIPWRIPEDLRHFRKLTLHKPCIMGRKTWASLPVKPLPKRTNIVLTRDEDFAAVGAFVAQSIEAALELAARDHPPEIMIIGGAKVYQAFLPLAGRAYLTEVHGEFRGDTAMPRFSAVLWDEKDRQTNVSPEGLSYSFVTLTRRSPAQ